MDLFERLKNGKSGYLKVIFMIVYINGNFIRRGSGHG